MNLFDAVFVGVLLRSLAKPNDDSGAPQAFSILCFWLRGILFLRVFEKMSALLLMLEEIVIDTRYSMVLLVLFTSSTAHALVGGGYLPANYFAVFFRALNIGVLGGGFPDEFLPEESLPDATGFGDLVMKIAIFVTGLYIVNMVMMNFLIAVMGDTFERVQEQEQVLALKNRAVRLLEVNAYCPGWVSGRSTPRFLLVCEAVNETEPWSGFSGEIKREVKRLEVQLSELQGSLENKLRNQHDSLAKLSKQQESLENKLSDQQQSLENKLKEQQKALENLANLLTSFHSQGALLSGGSPVEGRNEELSSA